MADANNPLKITDLDFDSIKKNLKDFLKTTGSFKDYDFEGSNLSTLIDVLAYNTYYNGYYLNMIGNEMFMDTAVLRESVLSRAKELNYVPQSAIAAVATVDLLVEYDGTGTQPAIINLPTGTTFSAKVGEQTYTFATLQGYTAFQLGSSAHYQVKNVELAEGEILSYTFPAHNSTNPQRYVIPNDNVDVNQLKVFVQTSSADVTRKQYLKADNLFGLDQYSERYFLQGFIGNQYEVVFGDDTFGRKLQNGNIVIVEYCATDGDRANGAREFTYTGSKDGPIPQVETITATIVTGGEAAGGKFEESVDSIRFRSPRHYATQFRAVTAADFKSLIEQSHPTFRSVRVYGGEDAQPPQFGKVFIAIRPGNSETLSDVEKAQVIAFLADKKVLTITPEVISPDYTYLAFQYIVNYDPDKTPRSAADIEKLVFDEIVQFGENNLGKFGSTLRASKFAAQVDAVDEAILGSAGGFNLVKRFTPKFNADQSFRFNMNNAIRTTDSRNPSVYANGFRVRFPSNKNGNIYDAFLKDDGQGRLYIYTPAQSGVGSREQIIIPDAGSVDYATGEIVINNVWFYDYDSFPGYISLNVVLQDFDVTPQNNQILLVDPLDVKVNAIPEVVIPNV